MVEAVPFARPGAHLTRDLDDLLAWLATRMDRTAVARLTRVSWRTVGRACERVVATELDPDRLDGLFRIGVDEIQQRRWVSRCARLSEPSLHEWRDVRCLLELIGGICARHVCHRCRCSRTESDRRSIRLRGARPRPTP